VSSLVNTGDGDNPSKYEEAMAMQFAIPKSQSALIQRIVRLRRDLSSLVFNHDDDKLDMAVRLMADRVSEQEFVRAIGEDTFKLLTTEYLQHVRELSILES
jgi:hypothetical protein